MTKKDFQLIASIIYSLPDNTTKEQVAKSFGAMLLYTNPRFNVEKFIKASTDPAYFKHRKSGRIS